MGWEQRGGKWYYYRKFRTGGRVRSKIVSDASGTACCHAELDSISRQIRDLQRVIDRGRRADAVEDEQLFRAWFERIEAAYYAFMLATGFHRHARGRWRKRRVHNTELARVEPVPSDAELPDLIRRARKGDVKAALAVRQAYADNPQRLVDLGMGDVGEVAERAVMFRWLADEPTARDPLAYHALRTKLELLKAELSGTDPSPIERLLVDRVVICWLRVSEAEVLLSPRDLTEKQIDRLTRRLNSAHSRYISALKALATVRKLALPTIQVNLAEHQTIVGQQNNAEQQVVGDVRK